MNLLTDSTPPRDRARRFFPRQQRNYPYLYSILFYSDESTERIPTISTCLSHFFHLISIFINSCIVFHFPRRSAMDASKLSTLCRRLPIFKRSFTYLSSLSSASSSRARYSLAKTRVLSLITLSPIQGSLHATHLGDQTLSTTKKSASWRLRPIVAQ